VVVAVAESLEIGSKTSMSNARRNYEGMDGERNLLTSSIRPRSPSQCRRSIWPRPR